MSLIEIVGDASPDELHGVQVGYYCLSCSLLTHIREHKQALSDDISRALHDGNIDVLCLSSFAGDERTLADVLSTTVQPPADNYEVFVNGRYAMIVDMDRVRLDAYPALLTEIDGRDDGRTAQTANVSLRLKGASSAVKPASAVLLVVNYFNNLPFNMQTREDVLRTLVNTTAGPCVIGGNLNIGSINLVALLSKICTSTTFKLTSPGDACKHRDIIVALRVETDNVPTSIGQSFGGASCGHDLVAVHAHVTTRKLQRVTLTPRPFGTAMSNVEKLAPQPAAPMSDVQSLIPVLRRQ